LMSDAAQCRRKAARTSSSRIEVLLSWRSSPNIADPPITVERMNAMAGIDMSPRHAVTNVRGQYS
jgi:hypothetical protein